ncbi:MAG: hypothetical protein LBQ46_10445, partial [Treponema sp.]|nr:hypothetical protein [Treponema sp.]
MRRRVLFAAALLMTVLMAVLTASCDLPQGPGTGTLTLFLASGEGPAFARSATGRDFPEDALGTIAY